MNEQPPVSASAAVTPHGVDGMRSLTRNGLALVLNSGTTAALGGIFWLVAARLYSEEQVGQDAALISAMLMIGAIAGLNVGAALPRFLPQLGERSTRVVLQSYAATTLLSIVLAIGFVLIATRVSDSFSFLESSNLALLLVLGAAAWNIFGLQDAVLTAVRRANEVLIENSIFGVSKLVLMVALGVVSVHHGVFYAWLVPVLVLLGPVNWFLFRALKRHEKAGEVKSSILGTPGARRRIVRFLSFDYLGLVCMQASFTLLPVLVVASLGAEQNAYFYIAYTVATTIGQIGEVVGLQLTVEGAFDENRLAELTRHTLKRFGMLLVPAALLMVALAPVILWFFGPAYADNATTLLRFLAISAIPVSLVSIYQAVERVRGNAGRILLSQGVRCALVLGLVALLIGDHGLNGVGWAWLGANTAIALAVTPALIRVLKSKQQMQDA